MLKRKFSFLTILLLFLSTQQFAQEAQKGKVNLSLSGIPLISWQNGYYGFALKPGLDFFITENFSVQNDFFYHIMSDYYIYNVKTKSNTFGFIPSLRYNFFISNRKWIFSAQAGVGFGVALYKPMKGNTSGYQVDSYNSGMLIYSAGLGVVYLVKKMVGIELQIPYIYADNVTNKYNADILFNGFGPTVGVTINLN